MFILISGIGFAVSFYATTGTYALVSAFVTALELCAYLMAALRNPGILTRTISD